MPGPHCHCAILCLLPAICLTRPGAQSALNTLPSLPIDSHLGEITGALQSHHAVIIQAPTGTGKTTRVPLALLDAGLAGDGQILVLQPRRIAARATAAMMASHLGEVCGGRVGYHIRFDRKASRQTKILVVTEGILTRKLLSDPLLEGVNCVVLDEFHERSIHTDLALAFVKELWSIRDDLKLIVMSATLDAAPLVDYLNHCPVVRVEVPAHPLDIRYDDGHGGLFPAEPVRKALKNLLEDEADDGGNILVFLPGVGDIRAVMRELQARKWPADLLALHGSQSASQQDLALSHGANRRIILATNIAETSLTLPGVTAVVDWGFQKIVNHDAGKGIDRLDLVRISQASATQRAGRAGRTGPGRVIRLWPKQRHLMLSSHEVPEILRIDLAGMLLQVLDFHGPRLDDFPFYQRPPADALERAFSLLQDLGGVDEGGRITPNGRKLSKLPLSPRLGAILSRAAELGCLEAGAAWCALLSDRPKAQNVHHFDDLWKTFQSNPSDFRRCESIRKQLLSLGKRHWPDSAASYRGGRSRLEACLLAGFPDRLCRRRQQESGIMVGGRGVQLAKRDTKLDCDLFLALDLGERGRSRTAAVVDIIQPVSLENTIEYLKTAKVSIHTFDEEREAVRALQQIQFRDLVLDEKPASTIDDGEVARVLAEAAGDRFDRVFQPGKKTQILLARLQLAEKYLDDGNWPDVSHEGLKSWLPEICLGMRSLEKVRRFDWHAWVWNQLTWHQRQLLDQELPESWKVPSGSKPKIDYLEAFQTTGLPVLAIRLQECFGMTETPRVARNRLPILLHLLAPNMRPVQVTQDLVNFWNTTYSEVRKELRQRYPKHAWPENPWEAKAIRGVPRRKKG